MVQGPIAADPVSGPTRWWSSGWTPLRYTAFRRWWVAQLISNVGSWMQTVAAQWVMISLTSSALLVGAIQATSLPVLLFALPAGVLGDLLDRKRLILAGQVLMLVAAAALGVADAVGGLTPALLLVLLCGIGVGQGLIGPTAQTLQPELVPRSERSAAIALGSVNQNLARAIGPAIGGLLLAAASAAVVFYANALSFVAVVIAVALVTVPRRVSTLPREHVPSALRAGGRFVRNAPALIAIMVRAAAFAFFAGGIWALLPLVARDRLGLGSGGYGILLGCVGIGAVLGATFATEIRHAVAPRAVLAGCSLALAISGLVLAWSRSSVGDGAVLVVAGMAWIMALGLLNSSFQAALPDWVKARAMAYYTIAFQGPLAVGALALGAVADATSLSGAFLVLAGGLVVGSLATARLALPAPGDIDVMPADVMPPLLDSATTSGPVLVTAVYDLRDGAEPSFLELSDRLRHSRRRTGASEWRLYRDPERPNRYLETFVVGSWEEHQRQHARFTKTDAAVLAQIDAMLAAGTQRVVHHYQAAP